ncbi:MAG: FeoB-associated Cys-rich membrane protein [Clostridia bacterium]|nr:FeoB-associated Cys-rich membrane protein [Clostridia bacterium]MBR3576091.1 FeoB-associated Cys-rich membrane protein [Clostridia bacterium]
MSDLIIILIIIAIVAFAGIYVYKQKKNGNKCIGCPHSKECHSKNCGCNK